jgi:hypothetical protein
MAKFGLLNFFEPDTPDYNSSNLNVHAKKWHRKAEDKNI